MPIYEYQCEKCGKTLEVIRTMSAPELKKCGENCAAEGKPGDGKVRRILSVSAVHSGGASGGGGPELSPCERCDMRGGSCPAAKM